MTTVRILQASDLHLTARAAGRVFGSRVWANLDRVLAQLHGYEPFDRLVLTGDLANAGRSEAYARLAERLQPWADRLCILPGNHDRRDRLRAAFPGRWDDGHPRLCCRAAAGGVVCLGLDSLCQGRTRGELGAWQLAWLGEQLRTIAGPWLLFLHHPPVCVGTWWLDKDLLRDRGELAAVLAAAPPGAIFAGHVHHEHCGSFATAPVTTCPSVAYQYRSGSWLPLPRSRAPAWRLIDVGPGGVVTSRVLGA